MNFITLHWQVISSVIGTVGGILGGWALLRSVWRERSRLKVTQKTDKGFSKYKRLGPGNSVITLTMVVSNLSSRANSVLRFEAQLMKEDGVFEELLVEQGRSFLFGTHGATAGDDFSVTPVNVPPHTSTECVLKFHSIDESKYRKPFELRITAIDMYGKRFTSTIKI